MAEASGQEGKKKKESKVHFFVNVSPASCYTLGLTLFPLPLLSSPVSAFYFILRTKKNHKSPIGTDLKRKKKILIRKTTTNKQSYYNDTNILELL
jgi:hypothetical protein